MSSQGKTSTSGKLDRVPIWDAHVHCYPQEVIRDPAEWARARGEAHWGELVTNGPQGWADPEALLRAMDRDGVEKVLLQAWYWENPDTAKRQNDWHAEWLAAFPDRFMACAAVHPEEANLLEGLQQAKEWGAVGVGECLPQVQDTSGWQHPAWEALLEWTGEEGWPICLHVTEPAGHAYPGRVETPFEVLLGILERHPEQKWILAHWGGGLPFYAMNRRVRKALRNVWFDSAASPLLYDNRVWKIVRDLVGAERILFGSDFPLLLYPRSDREPGWGRLLDAFYASGFSADDQKAVLSENLKQVLGVKGAKPARCADPGYAR